VFIVQCNVLANQKRVARPVRDVAQRLRLLIGHSIEQAVAAAVHMAVRHGAWVSTQRATEPMIPKHTFIACQGDVDRIPLELRVREFMHGAVGRAFEDRQFRLHRKAALWAHQAAAGKEIAVEAGRELIV